MISVITKHSIAYESPDHILPWGTMRDNSTSAEFIAELESYFFNQPIKMMDLGCSGGQLVVDFHNRGHLAVGLEGSDYSVKHQRANWPEWHNKILFTCDVTKEYQVTNNNEPFKAQLITAWEVVEHIHPNDLQMFFNQIAKHLAPNGIFLASVSTKADVIDGVVLHQSVFNEDTWFNEILTDEGAFRGSNLECLRYPFKYAVRADGGSFHILIRLKS
jgi:SAM-dependent methyltransferase